MESHDAAVSLGSQRKGYCLEFLVECERLNVIQQGLVCSLCDGILRDAVQVTCGERFCRECHQDICKREDATCPCERDGAKNTQHLVPHEVDNPITHSGETDEAKCSWLHPIWPPSRRLNRDSMCHPDNFCRKRVRGFSAQCINTSLGCSWIGSLVECEEHLNVCPFRNAARCYCGKVFQDPNEHKQHQGTGCHQISGAEAAPRACSSCKHPEMESGDHIERVCSGLQQLQTQLALFSPSKTGQQYQRLSNPVPPNDTTDATRIENVVSLSQYEALLNKYKSNTSIITVLFNEVKTCSQKLQLRTTNQEDAGNLERRISDLEKLVQNVQAAFLTTERHIHDVQVINTTSQLIWRIEDISQKIEAAQSGAIPALYSQPFFSGDAGYKMCGRLYLHGDGIGKGSHVSLYFVLMKGPYDPILSWLFTHRVTMQLMDQSGQCNHVQEKFRPDPNSSSFKKPGSEMNVATGSPRFISLTELERRKGVFVKDDTMFIRIIVE